MNNEPVAWIIDAKMTDCDDNFIWNTGNYPDWQVKHWIPLYTNPVKELTDEEINVVAILQDAEIVPLGHEIWKTSEEFNKYKRIVLATAKALRKAQEK